MSRETPWTWSDAGDLSALDAADQSHPFSTAEAARYRRGGALGRGGMGEVVRALDGRLLREVALKVPSDGAGSAGTQRRLVQEAWITAHLDHPGIVSVHDAGLDGDGTPFYVMRLVRGQTLEALVTDRTQADRLELLRHLRDVAEAVGYAHRAGFVHRDLKPANVMVGDFGETQVMDWGLACPVAGPAGDAWRSAQPSELIPRTVAGAVLGTPGYLSPEQAEGATASQASDVWSIGVMLHELVSGQRAFSASTPRGVLTLVRRGELPPLELPDALAPLGSIIARATQAEPGARYPDAKALADELTRYIEGGRVVTHRYTPRELLRETARTWRVPLLAVTAVLLAASAAVGLALQGARTEAERASAAEAQAVAARAQADENLQRALVSQALAAARAGDRGRGETLAAHALQLGEDPHARGLLLDARDRPTASQARASPGCDRSSLDPSGRWLLCVADDAVALWDLTSGEPRWSRELDGLDRVRVDPQGWAGLTSRQRTHFLLDQRGYTLATASDHGTLLWAEGSLTLALAKNGTLWRVSPGPREALYRCEGGSSDPVAAAGETAATVCFGEVVLLRGETVRTFSTPPPTEARGFPQQVALSETHLVWASQTGHVLAHALPGGALLWEAALEVGSVGSLSLSADGTMVSVLGSDLGVHVLDAETGETRWVLPERADARAAGLDADGRIVLFADRVYTWTLPADPDGMTVAGGVTDLDFSADGQRLGIAYGNGALVMDWETGERTVLSRDAPSTAKTIDLAAPGTLLGFTSGIWFDATDSPREEYPIVLKRAAILAEEHIIWASHAVNGPGLYRLDHAPTTSITQAELPVADLEVNLSGTAAVWANPEGVWWVGAPELEPRRVLAVEDAAVATMGGGRVMGATRTELVVGDLDGTTLWRASDPGRSIMDASFSEDGRWLAVGYYDGSARLYDGATGSILAELHGHRQQVAALAFHPTQPTLLTGSWDRSVRLWDLSRLDVAPEQLVADAEAAWGLTLEAALR